MASSRYINVGVYGITTKAELKRRIKEDPSRVRFYGTSDFTPFSGTVDELQLGVGLTVVGPNPQTDRRWYATVEWRNGKVVCS